MCKGNGGIHALIQYCSTHSQMTLYPISHLYFYNPLKVSNLTSFFLFGKWGCVWLHVGHGQLKQPFIAHMWPV